jgi:integrase
MMFLRWEEAVKIELAAESLRDRLIVRLCMYIGMRAHEVADAKIEHIDPIGGWVYIPHGHNSGPRYAAIDIGTLGLLAQYVGSRFKGALLTGDNGKPITRWIVYYAIKKAGENSGIIKDKPIGPLVLRHTFATTWLHKKGNIRHLQKQLGHAKLESTAFYLDWLPDDVKSEHQKLFEEPNNPTLVISMIPRHLDDMEGS